MRGSCSAIFIQSPYRSPTTNKHPIGYPYYPPIPGNRLPNQSCDQHDDSSKLPETGEAEKNGDDEAIEEIVRGISELYLKLPLELGGQVTLEITKRGNVTSYSETGSKVGWSLTRSLQGPMDELDKLERFMIKTINVGGISKDEEVIK